VGSGYMVHVSVAGVAVSKNSMDDVPCVASLLKLGNAGYRALDARAKPLPLAEAGPARTREKWPSSMTGSAYLTSPAKRNILLYTFVYYQGLTVNMKISLSRRRLSHGLSRRFFLGMAGAASLRLSSATGSVPVGLALFTVQDELLKDLPGTPRAVAKMGYQSVDFTSNYNGPLLGYFGWTPQQAKDVRKVLDDLGIRCNTTHNDGPSLTAEELPKAIELNHIIGSKYLVVSANRNPVLGISGGKTLPGSGKATGLEAWKVVAQQLTSFSGKIQAGGLRLGYDNHPGEFTPIGKRLIEVIAANTPKEVMLQLSVGACVSAQSDPVACIQANPGRFQSIHCKDWAPGADGGFATLFGEGVSPWPQIFAAAESVGGVQEYLIEQLRSPLPSFDTAQRCMVN
jgi:sugar phosphate isomerase/epimerase